MSKKRGLGAKRGLDALMGSIKKEREIAAEAIMPAVQGASLSEKNENKSGKKDNEDSAKAKKSSNNKDKPSKLKTNKSSIDPSTQAEESASDEKVALVQISPSRLQSGKYQPRRDINEDTLNELAASISQHGIMQPIVIRPLLKGENKSEGVTHEIIAGERRWRAAKIAGLEAIPAIERVLSDEVAIALALIENIQREDLNVLEQAAALQRFHTEFGMSHAMIADVVGKARTTVSNLLRLNQLHDEVKECMMQGLLDMGHARTLLSLSSEQQPIIAKKIIHSNMTVREAEKLVKSILNPEPKPVSVNSHELIALNQRLSDALGATVKLKQGKDGKGSMEIFFHNHDELNEIIANLGIVNN